VNGSLFLTWSFANGRMLPCTPYTNCPPVSPDYQPNVLSQYAASQYPIDLMLEMTIHASVQDREAAGGIAVRLVSLSKRREAAKLDLQSLIDQANKVVSQTARPAAGPLL